MTKPNFERFELDDVKGGKVHFTTSTDIVDYFEPARTFGESDLVSNEAVGRFQARLVSVPDRRSGAAAPMVFTIGSQKTFHLVRRTSETGSGWERIDLHTAFRTATSPRARVEAFGVDWTADDRFTLIAAVSPHEGSETTRVFVADDLSSENTDFTAIPWTDWGERKVQVQGLRVVRRGERSWLAILCGNEGPRGQTYLLQSRQATAKPGQPTDGLFREAIQFDTGMTLVEILHFDFGQYVDDGEAIHCLGKDRSGRLGLQSRAIPDFDAKGRAQTSPSVRLWKCPANANALALGAGNSDGADLYIGGDGVYVIPAHSFDYAEADLQPVIPPELACGIRRLVVAETAAGDASLWALDQKGDLHYVARPGRKGRWSAPLTLRPGVAEVAPVRGDDHVTTSVLLVYKGGHAGHLWRDAQKEGTWQEAEIRISDPEGGEKIACFGTNFRVLTENRTPSAGHAVKLSASVLSNLVVNGRSMLVGPRLPVNVVTADDGSIGIFNRATSFTPATYRLEVGEVACAIDLSPSANLLQRFSSMTSDELRAAKVNGRTPLLPEALRGADGTGKVDAFVTALNQTAKLAPSGNSGIAGLSFVDPDAPFSDKIAPAEAASDFSLTIEAGKDGIAVRSGGPIPKTTAAAGILGGIGETLSDFFESAWGKIKSGATYVIAKAKEGYKFICEVAGAVKEFVISKIEQMGKFFSGLWDTIVEAAEKVWDYLKFLFDWDDVIIVRNMIANAARQRITMARREVNKAKGDVSSAFTTMRENIQSLARQLGVETFKKLPSPTEISAANKLANAAQSSPDVEAAQNNSVTAWLSNNISSFFAQVLTITPPSDEDTSPVPDIEFGTILTSFELAWEALKDDLRAIVGPDFEIGDLNMETVKRIIIAIAMRVADTALSTFEVLIVKFLEIVEGLLGFLDSVFFSRISFPFLEKLIKFFTGKDVDVSFRLIDAFAMIVAVPTTLVYKALTGKRPSKTLETWTYPGKNRAVAQNLIEDILELKREWNTVIKLGSSFFNVILVGYTAFANNKMLDRGRDGGSDATFGILFQAKDSISAVLLFCTNVLGEGWEAISAKNTTATVCQTLLSVIGLVQVTRKVLLLKQRRADFLAGLARTGGTYRISSGQKFDDTIKDAAVDSIFGCVFTLLKTVIFFASDKTAVSAFDFGTGFTKYLSQILINVGTWKSQPKVLAVGAITAVVSLGVTVVGAVVADPPPKPVRA